MAQLDTSGSSAATTFAMTIDSEVQALIEIALLLQVDYETDADMWRKSPFAWIRPLPSKTKGAVGERLVSGWLAAREFNVVRSPDSDADRIIEGKRTEIKFSTLWKNGIYKFQQLRDQDYDIVICLGVSPFDAHCWALDKSSVLFEWHTTGNIRPQHGGSEGSDTAWISVKPTAPDAWLGEHGGSLREGLLRISKLTGFVPQVLKR